MNPTVILGSITIPHMKCWSILSGKQPEASPINGLSKNNRREWKQKRKTIRTVTGGTSVLDLTANCP
jgi:hypothetical protein